MFNSNFLNTLREASQTIWDDHFLTIGILEDINGIKKLKMCNPT